MASRLKQKNGQLYWGGWDTDAFTLQVNVTALLSKVKLCLRRFIVIPKSMQLIEMRFQEVGQ